LAVLKAKEPVVVERKFESEPITSKTETIVGENLVQADYHEADVDVKGVVKTNEFANYQEEVQHIEQIPNKNEVTWESIFEDYKDKNDNWDFLSQDSLINWLKENYNVPNKKQ